MDSGSLVEQFIAELEEIVMAHEPVELCAEMLFDLMEVSEVKRSDIIVALGKQRESSISRWLNGTRVPTVENLLSLCEALEVEVDEEIRLIEACTWDMRLKRTNSYIRGVMTLLQEKGSYLSEEELRKLYTSKLEVIRAQLADYSEYQQKNLQFENA